jgi:hypothetical protein
MRICTICGDTKTIWKKHDCKLEDPLRRELAEAMRQVFYTDGMPQTGAGDDHSGWVALRLWNKVNQRFSGGEKIWFFHLLKLMVSRQYEELRLRRSLDTANKKNAGLRRKLGFQREQLKGLERALLQAQASFANKHSRFSKLQASITRMRVDHGEQLAYYEKALHNLRTEKAQLAESLASAEAQIKELKTQAPATTGVRSLRREG